MKGGSTERLPKLDFLRAVSAAMVIAYHSGVPLASAGFGVLTFFVISGFLITFLLLKENQRTGTISLRNFYIRRSLRIFPAFYVYWIIVVAAHLIRRHSPMLWGQAICALLYVGNYYQGLHGYPSSGFSHTWSLGVEEQFYLLWPATFLWLRNRPNVLLRRLVILIPCLWVYRAILQYAGVADAYIYTAFETRVDAILVGCLLAIVLHTGAASGLLNELRRERYILVVLLLLAASLYGGPHLTHNYKNAYGFAVDPVLVGLLILQLTSMKGWAWMDAAPISYLGRISYSTYLYQQIIHPVLQQRLPERFSLVGCFLGIWAVAALSYEFVEKPFLRLKKRFEVVKVPEPGVEVQEVQV